MSLPKPVRADRDRQRRSRRAKLPRRVIAELSTFSLDDKAEAERVLRKAGHVMLDCPL